MVRIQNHAFKYDDNTVCVVFIEGAIRHIFQRVVLGIATFCRRVATIQLPVGWWASLGCAVLTLSAAAHHLFNSSSRTPRDVRFLHLPTPC